MNTDRLSRSRAPELVGPGTSSNLTDPTHQTKASDMYAFGVMAFEVWINSSVLRGSLTRNRSLQANPRFLRCPRLQQRTRC